jgi:hypothetical protein
MPLFRGVQGKGIAAEAAATGFSSIAGRGRRRDAGCRADLPSDRLRPGDSLERLQSRCSCSRWFRARASRLKPLQQVFYRFETWRFVGATSVAMFLFEVGQGKSIATEVAPAGFSSVSSLVISICGMIWASSGRYSPAAPYNHASTGTVRRLSMSFRQYRYRIITS